MISLSIVTRAALALCLGSALVGVSSAWAADAVPQQASASALLETLPAPVDAQKVIVEETGPYGVDPQSVNRHLAHSLKADSGLLPRNDARYSFNGNLRMEVRAARPAIGAPFGSERTLIEFPKLGTVQDMVRKLSVN